MTASLPPDRLEILRDGCGLQVFPDSKEAFEDLQRQSETERYNLCVVEEAGLLDIVKDAIANGKKVLWVVNTVSRCQERARDLKVHLTDSGRVFCYHSRFKLCDRRRQHNRVVQEFDKGTVVVATQVCEMSLDLDADVLITEIAPVTSIVQRMGRCCREPVPRNGRIGQVYIYLSTNIRPYEKWEIDAGKTFVEVLSAGGKLLCHADLGNYLAAMQITDPFIEGGYTGFLDAGPYAMAQDESFREGDEFTVDCVLDSDIDEYLLKRKAAESEADGYVVPVPRRFARENLKLGRYLREAPLAHYHPDFGFLDEEKSTWLKK
jgi:CRISPR-associated endonuclease/helicase Cas3